MPARTPSVEATAPRLGRLLLTADGAHTAVPVNCSVPTTRAYTATQREDPGHEDERHRGRGRVVRQLQELRLDHVADHVVLGRTEQLGVDEVTRGGDERQQRARDDAREREGQGDPQERLPLARVEILSRLEQPLVDLLQRDVQRQRHEGEEVVGDPGDDRSRCCEQPAARAENVQMLERVNDEAVVREDGLPGQGSDQIRDEERRDDEQQQEVLPPAAAERDPVRDRVAQQEREQRRDSRVLERTDELSRGSSGARTGSCPRPTRTSSRCRSSPTGATGRRESRAGTTKKMRRATACPARAAGTASAPDDDERSPSATSTPR